MIHFVEVRHNPFTLPSSITKGVQLPVSELIFIATESDYTLNHRYEAQQHIQAHVFRCIADNNGKHRMIASLIATLPEDDPLAKAFEDFMEDNPL